MGPWLKLSLMLTFISSSLSGQSYQGKVISADNKLEIHNVEILDSYGNVKGFTDFNGDFSLNNPGVYSFVKEGYTSISMNIEGAEFILVELYEKPLNLAEIVIKSNHFQSEIRQGFLHGDRQSNIS